MPRILVLTALVIFAPSCKLFFHASVPMQSVFDPLPGTKQAKCLMVLLPGAGDVAGTFRAEKFVEAIHKSGASADVVAANATLGYYLRGIAPERIELDVVSALRSRGYEQIWVTGISMGGFGSLHYTQSYPEHVDGVLALAPYLGDKPIIKEIREAGGLAKWTPDPLVKLDEDNYQRQLWSWLHGLLVTRAKGPEIYVGYGDSDGLGAADSLLAQALPEDHVFHAPGGHDWPPWLQMFEAFLKNSEFQRRCAN